MGLVSAVVILAVAAVICEAKTTNVMIMATTDVHGYVYGHIDEPGVYIDFGDLRRFSECMETKNSDYTMLRLDSGDLIQGTGLSDLTTPPGRYIYDVFSMFGYDALTIGNHDAGEPTAMDYVWDNDTKDMKDMFVSGNVFYDKESFQTTPCTYETAKLFGQPYKIIEKNGILFLILGFLYGQKTKGTVCNLYLQGVEDKGQTGFFNSEHWEDAQKDFVENYGGRTPDYVITLNHISSYDSQQPYIYRGVRAVYPDAMLVMLNGHTHNVEKGLCSQNEYLVADASNDEKCVYIEASSFMRHVGVVSLTLEDGVLTKKGLNVYPAKYDNLNSICEGFANIESDTAAALDKYIDEKTNELNVFEVAGFSNWLYLESIKQTNKNSLLRLFFDGAVPTELYEKIKKTNNKLPEEGTWLLFINAGTLRQDLKKGQILMENIANILPFQNTFMYFPRVLTGAEVRKVYEYKNGPNYEETEDRDYFTTPITPKDIKDDEKYTIISTDFDSTRIADGISKMLQYDDEWVEIVDVPKMMDLFELYVRNELTQSRYVNSSVEVEPSDVGALENENVAYLVLTLIFCVAAFVAQLVAGRAVKS